MNLTKSTLLSVIVGMVAFLDIALSAPSLDSFPPKKDLPEGWALIEGPKTYNPKTLFNRINGQAELFFKYGFQKSIFANYQDRKNPHHQVELDIYDMGTVLQAFGIFSRFREEDRPGGFGLDSYLDDQSILFYKGRYFVMLFATQPHSPALKRFATLIALNITDPSPPPQEIAYFPKDGLKLGSIQYFTEGLLGHQFLKRGFQGTYLENSKTDMKVEEKEFHLFIAIFKNTQESTEALRIYKDHLSKKGKVHSEGSSPLGSSALQGIEPYKGKVTVLHRGVYLLGAMGYEKEGEAEIRLTEFMKNIK
jgi:hypothetical protein